MVRTVEGKSDVGSGGVDEPRPGVGEHVPPHAETLGRQRGEQAPPVCEVTRRRGVRYAGRPLGQLSIRSNFVGGHSGL
jgi:hypothetical protein